MPAAIHRGPPSRIDRPVAPATDLQRQGLTRLLQEHRRPPLPRQPISRSSASSLSAVSSTHSRSISVQVTNSVRAVFVVSVACFAIV